MDNFLTTAERTELRFRHRKQRDGRVRDRIKVVLAYDSGYTYSEIFRILLLDDESVRRHIEDYRKEQKLSTNNGGSEGKLTSTESQALLTHLNEVTYLYVKEICAYVKQQYGKVYSISGMTKWLHVHKFCYKKPHTVPAKANSEQQEAFLSFYKELNKKTGIKNPLYFADSVHPHHQTKLTYGWILKGQRKDIPTNSGRKHLNITGGICLRGHRFTYTETKGSINADSIITFLKALKEANKTASKIHVIWDNEKPHHSGKVKLFANQNNIKLHYLPPYSPNLNPIERLWKLMHENVSYNRYYDNFAAFKEATDYFLKNIGRRKRILRKRITDNFQILQSPMFAP